MTPTQLLTCVQGRWTDRRQGQGSVPCSSRQICACAQVPDACISICPSAERSCSEFKLIGNLIHILCVYSNGRNEVEFVCLFVFCERTHTLKEVNQTTVCHNTRLHRALVNDQDSRLTFKGSLTNCLHFICWILLFTC